VIAIVDYGAGNLRSVLRAFTALGAEARITSRPDDVALAAGIVVPGVGHFEATRRLDETWRARIRAAIDRGTPLLGICLGMQWLYEGSDEAPGLSGLGIFRGRVFRLSGSVKVPHVGWNTLSPSGTAVYFTHSFAAPITADTVAITEHGVPFASIVERGRVCGMQFHPEKSGSAGVQLLAGWLQKCSANV
jgi:glutamine amidotransferase